MNGSGCDITFHAILNVLQDRSAVGSISKPNNRQHYRLLEGSEVVRHR